VLADFVAALHATDAERTYLRELDVAPKVMTAKDCARDLPVCNDVDAPALIESPCDKYQSCCAEVAAPVTAHECGPAVANDALFPHEFRALQKTYTVDHAIHFDIVYGNNFKVLNNHLGKEQYVLKMCNSETPETTKVDAIAPLADGFTRKHFTVPLQSYGSDTTGPVAYLDIIGVHDRQMFISQYATAPCLQKAMNCSSTMLSASTYDEGGAEALAQQIDSVDGYFRDYGDANSPKTIAVHSYLDPQVLNRAEWIKFVAAFFNKEDVAEQHMKEEEEKWEALTAEAALKPATPLVAFIVSSSWSGSYEISLAAYKTDLVDAAGGRSFTTADFSSNAHAVITGADPNPKIAFNMTNPDAAAAFRAALADVDVLIDETYAYDPTAYNVASFATSFGFDGAGARIFREDGLLGGVSGKGMDWFEGANAHPSVVLADFVAALHATDAERTYLRELDVAPKVMTAKDCARDLPVCNDVDTPALIESPCDKYQSCCSLVASSTATTSAPTTAAATTAAAPTGAASEETTSSPTTDVVELASSCIGAGLLLAAVALA
jgi:hypothetical protein